MLRRSRYPRRHPAVTIEPLDQPDAIQAAGLVTQMYIEVEPGNARDGLHNSLDPRERAAVTVRLDKAPEGKALVTRFDIVLRV